MNDINPDEEEKREEEISEEEKGVIIAEQHLDDNRVDEEQEEIDKKAMTEEEFLAQLETAKMPETEEVKEFVETLADRLLDIRQEGIWARVIIYKGTEDVAEVKHKIDLYDVNTIELLRKLCLIGNNELELRDIVIDASVWDLT